MALHLAMSILVDVVFCLKEKRKKQREREEKRLAAERAAEDERRKAVEVSGRPERTTVIM